MLIPAIDRSIRRSVIFEMNVESYLRRDGPERKVQAPIRLAIVVAETSLIDAPSLNPVRRATRMPSRRPSTRAREPAMALPNVGAASVV